MTSALQMLRDRRRRSVMATDGRLERSPVVAIFIVSGIAGLIYEVVWSRQLVLVFGNTTQAVSAILTGFFGGMALGNAVGGRIADRVGRPLRMYAVLELVLAAVVVATPLLFRAIGEAYRGAFGPLESAPQLLALVRFALALLALAPATVLMGATLPTLTRDLTRRAGSLSGSFGRLYAANTVGAVIGSAAAGLVLIELLGLTGTLFVGAACSACAGVLGLVVDRRRRDGVALQPPASATSKVAAVASEPSRLRLAVTFAFLSGATSLAYQTLWTRLLASGTGNSTYVFTFILMVFLTGLALGASAHESLHRRIGNPARVLGVSQLAIAAFAVVGLVAVGSSGTPAMAEPSPVSTLMLLVIPTVVVVLPSTLVMGFTLPVASQLLGSERETVGSRTGLLLAANTFGSIVGTFVVPFFVIPWLGSARTVAVVGFVNAGTGIALLVVASAAARAVRPGSQPRLGLARRVAVPASRLVPIAAVLALALASAGLMDPDARRIHAIGATTFASQEDEIASVQAGTDRNGVPALWVTGVSMTAPTVDTRLMPVLPLALRPQSDRALVVALGMGFSYRSALRAGLRTDVVELVPSVPSMLRWFLDDADVVRASERGRIFIADGRNHVELTNDRYDIVVVDPPPPAYSSGVSVISSLEWYQAVRNHLNPGGVMMQWVPYGGTLGDLRAHVRTFSRVFPHVVVALSPGGCGMYMFGSEAPLSFDDAVVRSVLARPAILADISSAADSPASTPDGWIDVIHRAILLSDGEAEPWAGEGTIFTDDHPGAEYFLLTTDWRSPRGTAESLRASKP